MSVFLRNLHICVLSQKTLFCTHLQKAIADVYESIDKMRHSTREMRRTRESGSF